MGRQLIAITGGIGAGKSVVSRILRQMGYPVYDSDSQAKKLMDADCEIKRRLAAEISAAVVCGGEIQRAVLAEMVFNDSAKLAILNDIVHTSVKADIQEYFKIQESKIVFVETAILYQSGLNREVDAEWRVTAPLETRIGRVELRNGLSRKQVCERIASQENHIVEDEIKPPVSMIENDGLQALVPQINKLLAEAFAR